MNDPVRPDQPQARHEGGSVAIALGESDLTAVEQASLFATLANGGVYPHAARDPKIVKAHGRQVPLRSSTHPGAQPRQAADVDYALSFDNVPGGTAYPEAAWPGPVVGKTGTTADRAGRLVHRRHPAVLAGASRCSPTSRTAAAAQAADPGHPAAMAATRRRLRRRVAREDLGHVHDDPFASLPVMQLPTPDYTGYAKWNQVGNLPKTSTRRSRTRRPRRRRTRGRRARRRPSVPACRVARRPRRPRPRRRRPRPARRRPHARRLRSSSAPAPPRALA